MIFGKIKSGVEALARWPMVGAAMGLMIGIALHEWVWCGPGIWLGVALLLAGLGWMGRGIGSAALMGSLVALGIGAGQIEHFYYPGNELAAYTTDEQRLAELEMRIESPPRVLKRAGEFQRPMPPRQVADAVVLRVKTNTGWKECSGALMLQVQEPKAELARGQRIVALGMLYRPAGAMNPGEFNWNGYFRRQRTLVGLSVPHARNVRIVEQGGYSPLGWMREKARELLAAGFSQKQSLDHALLRALLLGDTNPELRDVQEDFRRTGTSHHLAISGMHIAVLGGFIFLICCLMCIRPRRAAWITMLFVIGYGAAALPSPPVIRSVLLCVGFSLGILWRRSLDNIQLLACSLFAVLILQPFDLYDAGFQLSFGTVLGLMLLATPLIHYLRGNEELPATMQLAPFRIWWIRRMDGLRAAMGSCIIAWAVSAPMIAYHFEQMNPWTIPASLLLAPVVFLALIGGLFKVVLTLICPWLAGYWAVAARWPIEWMRHGVHWLGLLPGSDLGMPGMPAWLIALYYLMLLSPLLTLKEVWWRRIVRGTALAAGLAAFFLPMLVGIGVWRGGREELKVTLLSVGAGQCAVVQCPAGKVAMIDCGSEINEELYRRSVGPFLRHLGVNRIEKLILSHGDLDHVSAAAHVVKNYGVRDVLVSEYFQTLAVEKSPARGFLDGLKYPVSVVKRGEKINLGGGAVVEVLGPVRGRKTQANNCALVLKLSYRGRSILFPADIQVEAQKELLDHPEQLRADVLVGPHHGSAEKTTGEFLRAVNPDYVICSNDRTLTTKQKVFDRLAAGRKLYRTHESGAIEARLGKNGEMKVTPYNGKFPLDLNSHYGYSR